MIGESGRRSASASTVWRARISGSSIAMIITSGSVSLAMETASIPYPASPRTGKPESASIFWISALASGSCPMITTRGFRAISLPSLPAQRSAA